MVPAFQFRPGFRPASSVSAPATLLAAMVLAALAGLVPAAARAQAAQAVDGPAALSAALEGGAPGAVLELAPGDYGFVRIVGEGHPAVIRSADPERPARITSLEVNGVDGLTLQALHLDYEFSAGDPGNIRPFSFVNVENVTLRDSVVEGDRPRGGGGDGYGQGIGVSVRFADGVTIENNTIRDFTRGAVVSQSEGIVFRGNTLTQMRSDGADFAEVRDVLTEANRFHGFSRPPDSRDHPDFIQFWTNGTETASRNITIRGNLMTSTGSVWTQSIFMRNELVDTGQRGRDMYYRDVTIEDNVIHNAHLHGITVGETEGLTIRRNTVVQNPASAGESPERPLWVPTIRVTTAASGVRIEDNITGGIDGFEGQPGWRVSGNLVVQNRSSLEPGFYGRVFAGGDTSRVESFRPRPGGEADRPGLGAAMLRN